MHVGFGVLKAYGTRSAAQAYNPIQALTHRPARVEPDRAVGKLRCVSQGNKSAYTGHYSTANSNGGGAEGSAGGKAVASSTAWGNTAAAKTANGNMYAGHDGNVYKNTGSGWESYNNRSWNSVNKPSPQFSQATQPQTASADRAGAGSSSEMQGLQNEAQNRERGDSGASGFRPAWSQAAAVAYSAAATAVPAAA